MSKTHNIAPEDFYCYSCEDDLAGIEGKDWHVQKDPHGWNTRVLICDDCAASEYDG